MRRAILVAVSGLILGLLATLYLVAELPRRSLDRFLAEVIRINVGSTGFVEWRSHLEQARVSNWSTSCDQQTCGVGWRGENKLLQRLRLAPRSGIAVQVDFKKNIASDIHIWVEVDDDRDADGVIHPGTGATVYQGSGPETCKPHYSAYRKPTGRFSWGVVTMDSCVLRGDRAKAFAINTSCLTRIGGCKTPNAIIPQVFGGS